VAMRDTLLVSLMAMTGCRPGDALALQWSDLEGRVSIARRLSGTEIVAGTKTGGERTAPLLGPLHDDLVAMAQLSPSPFRAGPRARRSGVGEVAPGPFHAKCGARVRCRPCLDAPL
jgi:integrase